MKTLIFITTTCFLLASCGGGGGNAGTCEPTSACQKSNEMPRPQAGKTEPAENSQR